MHILKNPERTVKILALLLAAVLSFFVATEWLPQRQFVQESVQSVEDSRGTIMKFAAATLSASVAISALPDDFATPLAQTLSDMNIYFVFLLMVLFLEGILLKSGIEAAFGIMIPIACVLWAAAIRMDKEMLKALAARILVLALAVAFVVPCSTHVTNIVAAELQTYVEDTITETEEGVGKIDDVMESDGGSKTIFEKLSDAFHSAIQGVSDLLTYIQNSIRKCLNSIAILIVTDVVMPLLTFFVLKWVLKETFHVVIPSLPVGELKKKLASLAAQADSNAKQITAGEGNDEKQ